MMYAAPTRLEVDPNADTACPNMKKLSKCFSKIKNKNCFAEDIFVEYWGNNIVNQWIYVLESINLCGNASKQDMAQLGCLFWKQLYLDQHCEVADANDCQ